MGIRWRGKVGSEGLGLEGRVLQLQGEGRGGTLQRTAGADPHLGALEVNLGLGRT